MNEEYIYMIYPYPSRAAGEEGDWRRACLPPVPFLFPSLFHLIPLSLSSFISAVLPFPGPSQVLLPSLPPLLLDFLFLCLPPLLSNNIFRLFNISRFHSIFSGVDAINLSERSRPRGKRELYISRIK